MPPNLQAKLLKVLETGEVYPLGDTKPKIVDVRIISATNADIESRIKEEKFREDLYWRLNVIEIKIPPLRERRDDIEMLAKHFINNFAEEHKKNIKGLDKQALSLLMAYSWPGNVRELRNVIERSVVLTEGNYLTPNDLSDKVKKEEHKKEPVTGTATTLKAYINDYEKDLLMKIYETHNKNKEETARALGIDLATLYRKFKKYGIEAE
jgi:transcriptional regulator with PAS, ATPase and Fis domain